MGQDYSYTQPSSSSASLDTSLLEAEAELYRDEAVSGYVPRPYAVEADDGMPEADDGMPEGDDGMTATWYCGAVAETEELGDVQTQLRMLKEQGFELDQKLVKLQKIVCKKNADNASVRNGYVVVCLIVISLLFVGLAVMFQAGKYIYSTCAFSFGNFF